MAKASLEPDLSKSLAELVSSLFCRDWLIYLQQARSGAPVARPTNGIHPHLPISPLSKGSVVPGPLPAGPLDNVAF